MDESPVKNKQTSRVIDSLHGEIDDLKTELENVKQTSEDYKKKCAILAKKNDLFVDQLANAKHENESMILKANITILAPTMNRFS